MVIPYYLQLGSQNNKAARASVYVKAGMVNADMDDERRSIASAAPDNATDKLAEI